jgi:hypothetical protein
MAIILNDNIKVNAGKPSESKYLSTGNTVYSGATISAALNAVTTAISISERYLGLTVLVTTGGSNIEYWFKNGVDSGDLEEKKFASEQLVGEFITGATNLGYFSGQTGIQRLDLSGFPSTPVDFDDGYYYSQYNWYYLGAGDVVKIGTPTYGGPLRRAFVNPTNGASWIYSDVDKGWVITNDDVSASVGFPVSTYSYGTLYGENIVEWDSWEASGSTSVAGSGSLYTGATLTVGEPIYKNKTNQELHFRTPISDTPEIFQIRNDDYYVRFSANTGTQVLTASNGLTKTGQDVKLGGVITGTTALVLTGSSSLTITDGRVASGRTGIQYADDYSASFTDRSLIDKGYLSTISSSGGERIYKFINQPSHGFDVNDVLGWSGGTYTKAIADGTYNGEVIGIVTCCYNVDCFDITQAGYTTGLTGNVRNSVSGPLTPMIQDTTYFLSETVSGLLTCIEPSIDTYLSKSVLIATSASSGWVLPYAAYIISSGVSEGGPLIKSMCLPTSPYAMTSTDFFVGVAGGSLVLLPLSPKSGMVVVVADISGTALASPITVSGSIIGPQSSASINTDNGSLTFIWNGTTWSVIGFAPTAY